MLRHNVSNHVSVVTVHDKHHHVAKVIKYMLESDLTIYIFKLSECSVNNMDSDKSMTLNKFHTRRSGECGSDRGCSFTHIML